MNFYEIYYNEIAKRCGTDSDGAKVVLEKYIILLKEQIDKSSDEHIKTLWYEEFNGKEYPTTDEFLEAIFLFGENPFIPKTNS